MALINTLREKMGKVVVGVIAFSIAAFVLTDLFGPNSMILGGVDNTVGVISGEEVTFQEFQTKLDELSYQYSLNTGRNPNASELDNLRQQTWQALINDIAFQKQYNELGLAVTDDEVVDMVQGNNIAPEIRQSFTDPQTGQFNRDQVVSFLQNLANQPPQQQAAWYAFESNLGPARLRTKYENLIILTNNATKLEGQYEYRNSGANAQLSYLYVPFLTVSDSSISFTEEELEAYLDDNAERYEREASRSFNYVIFPLTPSAEDSAAIEQDLERIKRSLADEAINDSTFARANSDGYNAYRNFNRGNLPAALINDEGDVVEEGTIIGPEINGERYVVYKLSKVDENGTPSAKASHILINWTDDSDAAKAEAKAEAQRIINEIRGGAEFAEMARLFGTDGTASRGGDLGWFNEGQMVDEFEEAVFNATSTGLINEPVETQFGYHIIDVTETKTSTQYSVVQIEKDIIASDETRDNAYRQADMFSATTEDLSDFSTNADEAGVEVRSANNVGQNAGRISGLTSARGIVMWAFRDAEVGDISEVFELEEGYVIAALTGAKEKGTARLEDVRNQIENKVKNEKKAEIIMAQLDVNSGTLDDIAAGYGEDASVYSMTDLKLSANSLTGVGYAPKAVGIAFSLENGEKTAPFSIDNGVLVIEMENKTEAGGADDYSPFADQLALRRQTRAALGIDRAIKEFADIKDYRYKFF